MRSGRAENKRRTDKKATDKATDYRIYRLGAAGTILYGLVYELAAAVVGYLFYDSFIPCVILTPGIVPVLRLAAASERERRKKRLSAEFKELLVSLSANMSAGYSIETAFSSAYKELDGMYQGKSYMQDEVKLIIKGLNMNVDIETMLNDMAVRTDVEDIREFARLVTVSKGSGGNLIQLMKRMVSNMDSRLEVADEIDTMITSKRMEQNIMSAMPFAIIMYLRLCNPGYLDVLYGNAFGITAMSICLAVIVTVVLWGRRIVDIQV